MISEPLNGFAPIENISLKCLKVDELGQNHAGACQVPIVMLLIIYVAFLFYRVYTSSMIPHKLFMKWRICTGSSFCKSNFLRKRAYKELIFLDSRGRLFVLGLY